MDMMHRVVSRWLRQGSNLTKAIVDRILRGRSATSLIQAEIDDLYDDYEEDDSLPNFDSVAEKEDWEEKNLGILHGADIEKILRDTYVSEYRRRTRVDERTALEVFDPPRLPHAIVGKTLRVIAVAMATDDAEDYQALREMALTR